MFSEHISERSPDKSNTSSMSKYSFNTSKLIIQCVRQICNIRGVHFLMFKGFIKREIWDLVFSVKLLKISNVQHFKINTMITRIKRNKTHQDAIHYEL